MQQYRANWLPVFNARQKLTEMGLKYLTESSQKELRSFCICHNMMTEPILDDLLLFATCKIPISDELHERFPRLAKWFENADLANMVGLLLAHLNTDIEESIGLLLLAPLTIAWLSSSEVPVPTPIRPVPELQFKVGDQVWNLVTLVVKLFLESNDNCMLLLEQMDNWVTTSTKCKKEKAANKDDTLLLSPYSPNDQTIL